MPITSYNNTFLISCATIGWHGYIARDAWEHFTERDLSPYFDRSYDMFMRRLRKLKMIKRSLKKKEAKEMQFMLETLITTKNTLQESRKNT